MKRRNGILAAGVAGALASAFAFAQPLQQARSGEASEGVALSQAATALRLSIEAMNRQQPRERVGAALAHARSALVETQNAIATLASSGKASAAAARESGAPAHVSVALEGNEEPARGCWARLHEQPDYRGRALTLAGPADVAAVTQSTVPDWRGVGSLVLGPQATLVAQARDAAEPATLKIGGGQRLPNVTDTNPPGLLAALDRVQVRCED